MAEKKLDRRVQRTRALLNDALMQLIREKGYDSVTIEDITERANLGRTTFYLHYQSKDDLLLDHHAGFVKTLQLGRLTREQFLGNEPQPEMVEFLTQLSQSRPIYQAFAQAKEAEFIRQGVRDQATQNLTGSLEMAFPEQTPTPTLDILTHYLVGAQLAFIDWWVKSRSVLTPVQVATTLHQMRSAAIRDAYQIHE